MYAALFSLGIMASAGIGLYLGEWIAHRLPADHRVYEAQKAAQFGINIMATLVALVLGFMVTSARATFDRANDDVVAVSTSVLLLDRSLSGYGPPSAPIRTALRAFLDRATQRVASEGEMEEAVFRLPRASLSLLTQLQVSILKLQPGSPAEQWFQHRALEVTGDLSRERILTSEHEKVEEPTALLLMVASWIVLIFIGMGTFATHNASIRVVQFCVALVFSGCIFLIMELEAPYSGILRVSGEPLLLAAKELAGI
jgi:hypothetical protein